MNMYFQLSSSVFSCFLDFHSGIYTEIYFKLSFQCKHIVIGILSSNLAFLDYKKFFDGTQFGTRVLLQLQLKL